MILGQLVWRTEQFTLIYRVVYELLLRYPYTTTIDMCSFGCIVAEIFLGLPLFPRASKYDLIKRMIEIHKDHPPYHILRSTKNTSKYFKHVGVSS
jgi:dual specificity protein kinase YAK1